MPFIIMSFNWLIKLCSTIWAFNIANVLTKQIIGEWHTSRSQRQRPKIRWAKATCGLMLHNSRLCMHRTRWLHKHSHPSSHHANRNCIYLHSCTRNVRSSISILWVCKSQKTRTRVQNRKRSHSRYRKPETKHQI